jgi:peroxiredoxin
MIGKVTVLAAALFAASALSALAQEKNMTPLDIPMIGDMQALKVGDDAPAFQAKDTEGKDYAFSPKGNGCMLIFWSIFCEPCRAEMPLVQAMYDKYKGKGFEVVGVALDGDLAENIRQFAKQGKYTFRIVLDQESAEGSLVIAESFMVPGTPTIYLINKEGKITFSKVGRVGEEELDKAILSAMGQ